MLKYMIAIALIAGSAVYVSSQYNSHAQSSECHASDPIDNSASFSANEDSKGYVCQPKWNPPSWYRLFSWPDGLQVWGLFLTLIVIADQTKQTARAASATEDSLVLLKRQADLLERQIAEGKESGKEATAIARIAAEAALMNAQAVINAERALLLFQVEKNPDHFNPGNAIFEIRVINYGKVPARRIEFSKPLHAVMRLADFVSSPPHYEEEPEEIQEWLAPKKQWIAATFDPRNHRPDIFGLATSSDIKVSEIELIIYGQVTYFDGISNELRHSRYCFAHDKAEFSDIGGSLTPIGNEDYLECT